MSGNLQVKIEGAVGVVTLNRASALNALSRDFCAEIDRAVHELDNSDGVRVVLIHSALKHFCAGADIREMAAISADEAKATRFIGCVEYVDSARKPIVAAVNGLAAGGGCELVEMCDVVIAGESARFWHPEITLAAMPGAGGTQRLTRVVGKHVAMDMLLSGRALSANEAVACGLASRVVADDNLLHVAKEVAATIAGFSAPVAQRIKSCVMTAQVNLEQGLLVERGEFHRCFAEHDFREGVDAFLNKRIAEFQHR